MRYMTNVIINTPADTRTGTDLFADLKDEAEAVGISHFTATGPDLKAEVGSYIKTFQVGIHGGIHYIESPEQDEEQNGIIDIPPVLVAVETKGFLAQGFEIGFYLGI